MDLICISFLSPPMVVPSHHSSFLLVGVESHLSLIFIFPPLVLSSRHSSFLLVGMDLICLSYSFSSCVVSSLFFPTGGGRISLVSPIYFSSSAMCRLITLLSCYLPSLCPLPLLLLLLSSLLYNSGFWIRIQLSPDPAKNLNPDPEDLVSGSKLFLNTIGKKITS